MPQLNLHVNGQSLSIPFEGRTALAPLLEQAGLMPETPCGGNGLCGKCSALAAGGFDPQPDENGTILTCQAQLTGDAELYLTGKRSISRIETRGELPPCHPVQGRTGFAAAVDIGTTTLAARLVRLEDGKLMPPIGMENPQRMLAGDVIGRIQASVEGKQGLLTGLVRGAVEELLQRACDEDEIASEDIVRTVITGNTTMLYLYTGRNPEPLSHAPFLADCLFGYEKERVYYPPCFGAFVGADIYTAVLSSGMCTKQETALLADLGTNGELVLWHEGKLTCCATAAGPAFEGAGIRCGGAAVQGAVDRVFLQDGAVCAETIGGVEPVCICGSGLIDLAACLLDEEIIDETGFMEDGPYRLSEEVCLYQEDVRQLQLAKGAICAGMRTLLQEQGLKPQDVETLYIAGGFGTRMNLHNAARIGLFPSELESRAKAIGNAALSGAALMLLDESSTLANVEACCLNLAELPTFSQFFMEQMLFE